MNIHRLALVLCLAIGAPAVWAQAAAQEGKRTPIQPEAWQLVLRANAARSEQGVGPLWWDPALAQAALEHCQRMVQEGQIAHRYGGEPSVGERAAQAGAHFSLIEENVAIGPTPAAIHNEWMESPEHRKNLLSPEVDRVGTAVVASRGVLYAVADYAKAVPVLTPAQVEARVAGLMRGSGVQVDPDPAAARAACAQDRGMPNAPTGIQAQFVMRWQDASLTQLPKSLSDRLASGQFHHAVVGSCPAQYVEGAFTVYRVTALLY
jgi:hypothetical protein